MYVMMYGDKILSSYCEKPWIESYCKELNNCDANLLRYPYLFFIQASERAGILDPWIWLAKHSHMTGPAFYDTAHGPDFFSRCSNQGGSLKVLMFTKLVVIILV